MEFDKPSQVEKLMKATGGPGGLARRLKKFTPERCRNWLYRGKIPPMVVQAYRAKFLKIIAEAGK